MMKIYTCALQGTFACVLENVLSTRVGKFTFSVEFNSFLVRDGTSDIDLFKFHIGTGFLEGASRPKNNSFQAQSFQSDVFSDQKTKLFASN